MACSGVACDGAWRLFGLTAPPADDTGKAGQSSLTSFFGKKPAAASPIPAGANSPPPLAEPSSAEERSELAQAEWLSAQKANAATELRQQGAAALRDEVAALTERRRAIARASGARDDEEPLLLTNLAAPLALAMKRLARAMTGDAEMTPGRA